MNIYKITNTINGNLYIGKTTRDIHARFKQHCLKNSPSCMPIASAIKKYGKENFSIELLFKAENLKELNIKEIEFISLLKPHYNIAPGGEGGALFKGKTHSAETKKIIAEKRKGHKDSAETIAKKSKSRQQWKHKPESIKKWVDKQTKNWIFLTPENILTSVFNLKKFCIDNKLSYTIMQSICKGERLTNYKGYRVAVWG